MNYKVVLSVLGKVMIVEALLMVLPLLVGVIYVENTHFDFLFPILGLIGLGLPLARLKITDRKIFAREGFVIVALAWIIMSLFGAIPFTLSGSIENYVDAVFETVSGFTTTGSTILTDVEALPNSMNFWRLFTHWIGGMGVLVFVLAILPADDSGVMHIFRAESPGPSVGKLVSKMRVTARILYAIYMVLTMLEVVFLLCGGVSFFDSLVHSFATAGTGGFSTKNASIAAFNSVYIEMVIAVFMLIFSLNFNLFYLILIGNVKKALCNEELRAFLIIIVTATLSIAINLTMTGMQFLEAMRYSFFQVSTISSTTGFTTANFDTWPAFSKGILVILMIIGAMAGSTGGGIKVSRLIVLIKSGVKDIKKLINPRAVVSVRLENQPLEHEVERGVRTYFVFWVTIVIVSTLLLCIDFDNLLTNLIATLACIGNIGPGLQEVGPIGNFAFYSPFSKILLSFVMLVGRLEIFPMLILFAPRTWKRG